MVSAIDPIRGIKPRPSRSWKRYGLRAQAVSGYPVFRSTLIRTIPRVGACARSLTHDSDALARVLGAAF
jgi:hypothetical protein